MLAYIAYMDLMGFIDFLFFSDIRGSFRALGFDTLLVLWMCQGKT